MCLDRRSRLRLVSSLVKAIKEAGCLHSTEEWVVDVVLAWKGESTTKFVITKSPLKAGAAGAASMRWKRKVPTVVRIGQIFIVAVPEGQISPVKLELSGRDNVLK